MENLFSSILSPKESNRCFCISLWVWHHHTTKSLEDKTRAFTIGIHFINTIRGRCRGGTSEPRKAILHHNGEAVTPTLLQYIWTIYTLYYCCDCFNYCFNVFCASFIISVPVSTTSATFFLPFNTILPTMEP